ncbi:MAG: MurR/RpiR family transcriptional regulator [Actinobacteria bacterium]|nr:MurR/RpiR family transcriptional regulator [Actinomycetota bacterium]
MAEYLARNPEAPAFSSAAEIGRAVGVSEATVIRLAYAISYKGFSELQDSVRKTISEGRRTVGQYEKSYRRLGEGDGVLSRVIGHDIQNLRRTLDTLPEGDFNRAVELLEAAPAIFVTGARTAYTVAYHLALNLNNLIGNTTLLEYGNVHFYHHLARIKADSVVVGIGFPRYTDTTLRVFRYARERGSRVVAITDSPVSPLGRLADITLAAEISTPAATDSYTTALSLVTAVVTGVAIRAKDRVAGNLARLESAYSQWGMGVESDGSPGISDRSPGTSSR